MKEKELSWGGETDDERRRRRLDAAPVIRDRITAVVQGRGRWQPRRARARGSGLQTSTSGTMSHGE